MPQLTKLQNEHNEVYAERLANLAVEKLQGLTDEVDIKNAILPIWKSLLNAIPNENSIKRPAKKFREIIREAFPDKNNSTSGYYFTAEGKGKVERYQYLAFWYVTTNQDRWKVVGEEARKQYFGSLPELPKSEITEAKTTVEAKPEIITTVEPTPELTLKSMNIKALELDADTQQIVQNALTHSGLSLAKFIQKACTIYATTLTGKAKQFDSDLSAVETQELLSLKYKTHPGRAEELAKRAIVALENHNNNCTEKSQKWMITQTSIQSLIGSKPVTVKAILENYKTRLDDHNSKHNLSPYDNRKKDKIIQDDINLAELVPNGLDLL